MLYKVGDRLKIGGANKPEQEGVVLKVMKKRIRVAMGGEIWADFRVKDGTEMRKVSPRQILRKIVAGGSLEEVGGRPAMLVGPGGTPYDQGEKVFKNEELEYKYQEYLKNRTEKDRREKALTREQWWDRVADQRVEVKNSISRQRLEEKYLESYEVYKSRVHPPYRPMSFITWYVQMQDDYNRQKHELNDTSLEEFIKVQYNRPSTPDLTKGLADDIRDGKFRMDGVPVPSPQTVDRVLQQDQETKDLKVTVEQKPERNLVEWLPRCPVTGDERISIKIAGGVQREYHIFDQTHLPVRVLHLQYLNERYEQVLHSIFLDKGGVPIGCTCKDHKERKVRCKHMRALTVALPKRPEPLHFE